MGNQDFNRQYSGGLSNKNPLSIWHRLHLDPPLFFLLLLLCGFGLLVLFSASGQEWHYVKRQAIFMGAGLVAMLGIAQVRQQTLRKLSPWLYLAGILFLLAVVFWGVGAKGAQRWLDLPGLPRFQPSEIMKLMLPIALASFFSERHLPPGLKHIFISLIIIGVPTLLIARQPDLGTSILIAASGIFVLFLAGLSWGYIALAAALFVPFAASAWFFLLKDYQKQRILTLMDPEADKLGAGWNIIQSKTAIGSGGIDGKGWLHGTQSQLNFLPESHTDFIIAVLAEEFGLKGVIFLMLIYLLILLRGLMIGLQAQDTFGRLVCGSITLTFFVYIFVNIGMVSGLLPVVGVPLPLVSHGGTSVITLLTGFGLLMATATEQKRLSHHG